MTVFKWLPVAFVLIALAATLLRKWARWSKAVCCALCMAACVCAVMVASVWQWMPRAFRPVMRVEAMREADASQTESGHIWLRNVFAVTQEDTMPIHPRIRSGVWAQDEFGLHWQAVPEVSGQTDSIEVSLTAAESYAVFFLGDRTSGKVLLTYPDTGASEIVDTYRDSDEAEMVIVDIALDGAKTLGRIRRASAIATIGCALAAAALFWVLCRALRNRRAAALALEQRLARTWRARTPLDPQRWKWYSFALCALSVIPLLWVAFYAHPFSDDFSFAILTRHAWRQTGAISAVFQASVRLLAENYQSWQGTFASTFLLTLQPGIFGEGWYILVPYLLIGGLVLGTWLLTRAVVGKRYGGVLAWLALFFSIQFVGEIQEAFFWYTGGLVYTFFYSLSLILFSLALWAHRADKPAKRTACLAGACLLAIVVGGGNYVTALLASVLLALLIGYRMIRRDRRWWIPLAAFACLMGSFMISVLAPGNAVRQSTTPGMSAIAAILASFPQAFLYLIGGMRVEYLLGVVFAIPFLYRAAERSGYSFRYPGWVTLASLCVYACQTTPHMYAAAWIGPPRLTALYFYTSFFWMGGNLYYWLGWVARRGKVRESARLSARWAAMGAAVLLLIACAVTAVREPHTIGGVCAAIDLLDGTARRYGQVMDERVRIYEDETIRDALVPRVLERPHVYPPGDIVWDSSIWHNTIVAEYYGKSSVRRIE